MGVPASHSEPEPDGKGAAISSENERGGRRGRKGRLKKKKSCRESCNGDGFGKYLRSFEVFFTRLGVSGKRATSVFFFLAGCR